MTNLDGYTLDEHLAQGHLTPIYRATRRRDRTPVIVKLLTVEFPAPDQLGRIQREFELVRALASCGCAAHRRNPRRNQVHRFRSCQSHQPDCR